jgi:hypothetical protein
MPRLLGIGLIIRFTNDINLCCSLPLTQNQTRLQVILCTYSKTSQSINQVRQGYSSSHQGPQAHISG